MDDVARYNRERWTALASARALFTRPKLNLDETSARDMVDPDRVFGNLAGKKVLCLAGGGGQQSAAFGLLKADVTVVDLSPEQLDRDRATAAHYGLSLALHQGDMRDLSMLPPQTFDIVYHPYSLNFVPDAAAVFEQVARVIRHHGIYAFMCANPFAAGVRERDWNGTGYTVSGFYEQGEKIEYADEEWVYDHEQHSDVKPPVEYRQTLDKLMGGLVKHGFIVLKIQEVLPDSDGHEEPPGTWGHFMAVLPPWLNLRAVYRPDVFA